jgi:hypothetical protein
MPDLSGSATGKDLAIVLKILNDRGVINSVIADETGVSWKSLRQYTYLPAGKLPHKFIESSRAETSPFRGRRKPANASYYS